MARRFDINQPYRPTLSVPLYKVNELFSNINNLNTQEIKQFSINNNISLNVDEENSGDNLIHKTIILNHPIKKEFHKLNMIKFLVQNGVDPDKPNKENQTPLHLASKFQYSDIVKYLINLGVNVNYQDNFGLTPLHYGLLGNIKLIDKQIIPTDFIKKPTKINLQKNNNFILLKKNIWEIIKDNNFIQILNKTIDDSIFIDMDVKNKVLSLQTNMINYLNDPTNQEILALLKTNINVILSDITNSINNKWFKFNNIGDLDIHQYNSNLNSFQLSDSEFSPLKNSNIKTNIINEISGLISEINKLKINLNNFQIQDDFDNFVVSYYKKFIENQYNFGLINDEFINENSADLADNVVYQKKIFMGGSRDITINNDFNRLKNTLNITNIKELVLKILSEDLISDINDINTIIYPYYQIGIQMCYYAIFDSEKIFDKTNFNFQSTSFYENFYNKWIKTYKRVPLEIFVYGVYTASKCKNSQDNLTCQINSEFSMLVSALSQPSLKFTNLNQKLGNEIIEASKKFYFNDIVKQGLSDDLKIINILNILLNGISDNYIQNSNDIPTNGILRDLYNILLDKNKYQTNDYKLLIKNIFDEINKKDVKPHYIDIINVSTCIMSGCNHISIELFNLETDNINLFNNIQNNQDRFQKIIELLEEDKSSLISSYLFHLLDIIIEDNYNESIKKYFEAKNLGLIYNGLLPNLDYSQVKIDNIILKLTSSSGFHFLDINNLEMNDFPFFGSYVHLNLDISQNLQLSNEIIYCKNYDYFIKEKNIRIPILDDKLNYSRNVFMLQILINKLLEELKNIINNTNKGSKVSKIFVKIYPILGQIFSFRFVKHDLFNKFIELMNKYNSYILLYHYLLTPEKLYKVPKFNYYEIPSFENKIGKFLYFDNEQKNIFDISGTNDINEETKIQEDLIDKTIYLSNYELNELQNTIMMSTYKIEKNDFVSAKNSRLPPSMKNVLYDFYRLNLISLLNDSFKNDVLLKLVEQYINDNKLPIKHENSVQKYYLLGLIIQEIVKQQGINYISKQANYAISTLFNIQKTSLNLSVDLALPIKDLNISLASTKINLENLEKEYMENAYPFSILEDINMENKFIIYPEEYAISEILFEKYELEVKDFYKDLLENGANPYLLNTNNESAIYNVLKMHNYKIIGDLHKYIDFRDISENTTPYNYLINEHKNHCDKLVSNGDFKLWLNNFTFFQMNEVKEIIKSTESFRNNYPRYLNESFSVVAYITFQYLSDRIYRYESKEKLKEIISLNEDYYKYLYLNEKISDFNVYTDTYLNILSEIKFDKLIEINNIQNKIKKMNQGKTKYSYENLIKKLSDDIKKIDNVLINKPKISKVVINNKKILDRYRNFDSLGKLLSDLVKSDLNDSKDLLIFELINKEKELIKTPNIINIEKLKEIGKLYEFINTRSEMYFTHSKYTDDNKSLEFTQDLLEFATEHFIINSYKLLLRRVLLDYLRETGIDDDKKIHSIIEYLFDYETIFEGKYYNIETVLKEIVVPKIVKNCVFIYKNEDDELEFRVESIKDILDNVINLFTINQSYQIPSDSIFFKNMSQINSYFDTFSLRTITSWYVIIENVFKFTINQGRIVNSICSLF